MNSLRDTESMSFVRHSVSLLLQLPSIRHPVFSAYGLQVCLTPMELKSLPSTSEQDTHPPIILHQHNMTPATS